VIDVDVDALVIEATGTPDKIRAMEELLRPYGIVEMARTGRIALARGGRALRAANLRTVPTSDRNAS
jgi:acetolactate synthase-1/3 small subunit